MKIINASVFGPYKLYCEKSTMFDEEISNLSGIYLWTVKYKNNGYLVNYVGETGISFKTRMKEHLINTLGGNYRISDPTELVNGIDKVIWNGLWRKGTKDKIKELLSLYSTISQTVIQEIKIQDIFLIPLDENVTYRRLIEGRVAEIIKTSPSPISNILPKDIRYVKISKMRFEPFKVIFNNSNLILGFPKEIIIN